jgi:malate dehydrogenase (oxaloacetate-decarboxylating)
MEKCFRLEIGIEHMEQQFTPITDDEIFESHLGGKLSVGLTAPINNKRDLSIAYTPGVAKVSAAIHENPAMAETHTWANRLVVVVSDGTAVLGLGDIGPAASLPVMEGKSALFQRFAGLNSIPLVIDTHDVDEIVETLVRLKHSFGAVNLEDIAAPRCFELEQKLIEALDMPVMHDDQHGTAVVVLAAMTNAAKIVGKNLADLKVVISGAGSAGLAVSDILVHAGIKNVLVLDSKGVLNRKREDLSGKKKEVANQTNPENVEGKLAEALVGADAVIGLSTGAFEIEDLKKMAENSIIFALSNPTPEVDPAVARQFATVVATGRSDFPNQINNVLAFPGIFLGALDANARRITTDMKVAAANAIADLVSGELSADYIIPSPFDERVCVAVANAVMRTAKS